MGFVLIPDFIAAVGPPFGVPYSDLIMALPQETLETSLMQLYEAVLISELREDSYLTQETDELTPRLRS